MICLFLTIFLLVFLNELRDITPIARIYPLFVIIGSYAMIFIVVIQGIYRARKFSDGQPYAVPMEKSTVTHIIIYCAAILAYIFFMDRIGYFISSMAFMAFSLFYQKNRSKLLIVTLPIVFTSVMYYIFSQFLYVTLPVGSWIEKFY